MCGHICMYVPKKLEQKVSNHITVLGRGSPHRQRSIRQKSSPEIIAFCFVIAKPTAMWVADMNSDMAERLQSSLKINLGLGVGGIFVFLLF